MLRAMFVGGLLLAHQGGWDEALMVLVPIGIFVALVRVAQRREADDRLDGGGGPGRP